MTKDIYNILKERYSDTMYNTYYCDFFRNLNTPAKKELDGIYKRLFGNDSRIQTGCGTCVLADLKLIAKEYYNYKPRGRQSKTKENKDNSTI